MSRYPVHPLVTKAVPEISEADYVRLEAGIKEHGLLHAIVLFEGQIIDGRTRDRICAKLGVEPRYVEYDNKLPLAVYILQTNLRRNLTDAQMDSMIMVLAKEVLPVFRKEAQEAKKKGGLLGTDATKKGLPRKKVEGLPDRRKNETQKRFRVLVGKTRKADDAIAVLKHDDLSEKVEKGDLSLRDAAKEVTERNRAAKAEETSPAVDAAVEEQRKREEAQWEIINAPSLYPVDAPLPVHPTRPEHTVYIQTGIEELRKNEPLIGKMSRGKLFKDIHTYTQRIQTYGLFRAPNRVTGEIDQRFVEWAGAVFLKLRAREQMLQSRKKLNASLPTVKKKKGPYGRSVTPRKGDEFQRLFKSFSRKLRQILEPVPFQFEERLATEMAVVFKEHFAAKREAYATRSVLHTNGARTPTKN